MSGFTPILFSVILIFSGTFCHDYSITPITTSSGLYYEKVGEVLLSNSNWQFVTSVDYKGYLLFYEYLLQQADKIRSFCERFESNLCFQRFKAIQTILDTIQERDEQMANFLGVKKNPTRTKRFWTAIGSFLLMEAGGALIKNIFGGGESNNVDLAPYDRAIDNLQNGQRELENQLLAQRTVFMIDSEKKSFQIDWLTKIQDEIKNKVSSLESSVQMDKEKKEQEIKELQKLLFEAQEKIKMQETHLKELDGKVDKIEKELTLVKSNIEEIEKKVANNEQKINKLEVTTNLEVITTNFNYLMDQFKDEQKTLFDVIKNAARGSLDPYILTPLNLVQMLQDIHPNLPEGTKFPYYPNIENSGRLYSIIKPSVYLFNYKIIFILNIPLVYSKTLNLQKITSLPVSVAENRFAFILPQEPFMLIDNKFEDYMLWSAEDVREFCYELEKSKYICKQVHETLHLGSSKECEVTLFTSPKRIPESCNKRIMSLEKPIFLQLQEPRTWIYVVPETENVLIHCETKGKTEMLKGSGFIHVNDNCLVRTTAELLSLAEFSKPVESNFSPPLNLSNNIDLTEFGQIEKKGLKNTQLILPYDFKKLEEVSYGIIIEKKMSLAPLYYALLALVIVLVFIFTYLAHKKIITCEKLRNVTRSMRMGEPATDNLVSSVPLKGRSEPDNLKMKKVNNAKHSSIHDNTSESDEDSEYFAVRFQTEKNKAKPSASEEKGANNYQNNLPPKVLKEERYLNELRKLKPNANQL